MLRIITKYIPIFIYPESQYLYAYLHLYILWRAYARSSLAIPIVEPRPDHVNQLLHSTKCLPVVLSRVLSPRLSLSLLIWVL